MAAFNLPGLTGDMSVMPLVCVEAPIVKVSADLKAIQAAPRNDGIWEFSEVELDFERLFHRVPPLGGAHLSKLMLWEPENKEGRTAILSNHIDAHQRTMLRLNEDFGHQSFRIVISDNYEYFPECRFEFLSAEGRCRMVEVFNDDKWEFRTEGMPESFEDPKNYTQRRKRARLTPEIVIGYLKKIGWDLTEEAFWRSNRRALLAEQISWSKGPVTILDFFPNG